MSFKDFVKEAEAAEEQPKGIVVDIEKDTTDNTNFRKDIFTGEHLQLVLMSLNPNEDIGEETHEKVDQFFRVDGGSGKVVINGKETEIKDGSAFVVPAGSKHNVIADDKGLKVYTIYAPPNHKAGVIHKTKEEAQADTTDKPEDESKEETSTEKPVKESVLGQDSNISEIFAGKAALDYLKKALEQLEIADQSKSGNFDDWKHFKSMIQEIISTDNGEAGLQPFVQMLMDKKMNFKKKASNPMVIPGMGR